MLKESSSTIEQVDALNDRADRLKDTDLLTGIELAQESKVLAQSLGYPEGLSRAQLYLGNALYRLGRYPEARSYFSALWEQLSQRENLEQKIQVLLHLGNTERNLGNSAAALEYFSCALGKSRTLGNLELQAKVLNAIANSYYTLRDYQGASEHYLESLELARSLGHTRMEATTLANLGAVYQELGEVAKAAELYQQSLDIQRQLDNPTGEAILLNNLGYSYYQLGEYSWAIELTQQALAIARKLGNKPIENSCLANLGQTYMAMGQLETALGLQEQALQGERQVGNKEAEAKALTQIGLILNALGQPEQAITHLHQALGMANQTQSHRAGSEVHLALAQVYEALGNWLLALKHHKTHSELERASLREQQGQNTSALLIRFQTTQAIRQAEEERLRNTGLAQANAALQQANQEKTALLEQLRTQAAELERLVREDPLTQVFNRRHFEQELNREFQRSRRYGVALSLALIDLDHFKQVNDRFSHPVGDEVLRTAARIFKQTCRTTDLVARYGGEEFVLVFTETPLQLATEACERVRQAIEGYNWSSIAEGLSVSASMGVCEDAAAPTYEKLISKADERLYQAKREGRNRVVSG